MVLTTTKTIFLSNSRQKHTLQGGVSSIKPDKCRFSHVLRQMCCKVLWVSS